MQGFPALRKTVTTKWKNSIIFQMCFILPITWKFAQNLPSLLFSVYKHYAINIADPNSIQDTCHMNFVIDLAHCHCLWLSGRALECRIRRSEIRFLIGTRNFFFVPHSWHNRKKNISPPANASLAFAPLYHVDEWMAKSSPFSVQGHLSKFSPIMASKTLKSLYAY